MARAVSPRYFGKDFDPNVYAMYYYNKKAVTSSLLTKRLENFERTMRLGSSALWRCNQPQDTGGFTRCTSAFLSPNTTAHLHPNDAGIIRNFKLHY